MIVRQPPLGTPLNRSHPLSQGLIGCWLLNEGGGNLLIDSSLGSNGTLTSCTRKVGILGNNVAFDGSTSYGLMTKEWNYDQTTYLSVSCWLYKSTTTANVVAVAKSNSGALADLGWIIDYAGFTAGQVEFIVVGSSTIFIACGAAISTGVWYHIVAVLNANLSGNGRVIIYINGVLQTGTYTTQNVFSTLAPNNANVSVGAYEGQANKWDGNIGQILIYNRALSATDVRQLYVNSYQMFHNYTEYQKFENLYHVLFNNKGIRPRPFAPGLAR